ncbi:hypothetical protein [Limosilactobacillus reuteri]|uniref:hypothetical protein n=1 Tax=Limosilactobacillus reuteri TaxID=1598 RepID=UPI00128D304D|nr:hypothetical protein [Limosilactobacillus reuteri]MQB64668.1 hypothetical protein [Limosilactobacillus reuteri]
MLHKYRKTATIKAEQFDGSDEMISRYGIVDLAKAIESKEETTYVIPTKEGSMELKKGDYISTGIDGEHWPVKKSIFERTYERCD